MASVRKRVMPSGKSAWVADFLDNNGRRRSKQFHTKREAEAFLVTTRAKIASGTYVHESKTLREAAERWLVRCWNDVQAGYLERTSYVSYEAHVRLHLLDDEIGLGSVRLNALTRAVVADFRDKLLEGRSLPLSRKVVRTLALVVTYAQDNGWAIENNARGLRFKTPNADRARARPNIPSKEEVRRLIVAADQPLHQILIVAALCGLRAGEIYGLRWEDVDFHEKRLHVRQRADRFGQIGAPKTEAGDRQVPLGPFVLNSLRRWKLRAGRPGLVFSTRTGRPLSHDNVAYRWFRPLQSDLLLRLRFHDLRHFAISCWIEQGFAPKAIQTFAGHSSITTTFDLYGHLFPKPADEHSAMARVENRVLGELSAT